ncbi:class I SAM-dependent methyltransferase [Brevibacterium sp. GP-SGM9]|uniref:class I SAM-dependent methyltransferase n=1 Tax=Brevibacterium sp. GP-SGM9 TaxID=3376990 RepID=UPI0039A6AB65
MKPVRCTVPLRKGEAKSKNEHYARTTRQSGEDSRRLLGPPLRGCSRCVRRHRAKRPRCVCGDARRVSSKLVDVGCGTGTLATMLVGTGIDVVAVDPSSAALGVARVKPFAGAVHWILGTAPDLPRAEAELAFMTANVAQEFLTDEQWAETLDAIRRVLRPGGRLVFESRNPQRRAWEGWTKERTHQTVEVDGEGQVESWVQLTSVDGEFVSFVGVTIFGRDGERVDETSTLRFRSREALTRSLEEAGFTVDEVRDAPDRTGPAAS